MGSGFSAAVRRGASSRCTIVTTMRRARADATSRMRGLTFKEIVFDVGRGHALFYTPERVWLDRVVEWALGG